MCVCVLLSFSFPWCLCFFVASLVSLCLSVCLCVLCVFWSLVLVPLLFPSVVCFVSVSCLSLSLFLLGPNLLRWLLVARRDIGPYGPGPIGLFPPAGCLVKDLQAAILAPC